MTYHECGKYAEMKDLIAVYICGQPSSYGSAMIPVQYSNNSAVEPTGGWSFCVRTHVKEKYMTWHICMNRR